MLMQKAQCEACGAALNILSNRSRAVCPYCGMVYFVKDEYRPTSDQRTGSASSGRRIARGDQPNSVIIKPLPRREIDLGRIYAPKSMFSGPESYVFPEFTERVLDRMNGAVGRQTYNDPAEARQIMRQKMLFFLDLSRTLNDSFVLKGQFPLDVVPCYFPVKAGQTGRLEQEEISLLQTPKKVYWDNSRFHEKTPVDRFKRMNAAGETVVYDETKDPEKNREHRQIVKNLIKPYGFSCTEEGRFTSKDYERYRKVHFLQSMESAGKEHYREWVKRFSLLTAQLEVNPKKAADLMSAEDSDVWSKMGRNAVVDELAHKSAQMLGAKLAWQLQHRKPEDTILLVEDTGCGIGWIGYSDGGYAMVYCYDDNNKRVSGTPWAFRQYGMSNLSGVEMRCVLAALVVGRALNLCEQADGEANWSVTGFEPAVRGYRSDYTFSAVRLSPTIRTEGVYNSWL